jgi:nicotinamide-nucleotide amidase
MKASVLGIGTELTDGQIVNKNAAWISAQLKEKGFITDLHLVVPDHREGILEALGYCAKNSDWIFVTGGLGPTSDDFTRNVVAEWAKLPLEFHESSWQHVQERLVGRGFAVREIQKQQCYFPKGAEILNNTQGTANAFRFSSLVSSLEKEVFVLPGPPREIEAIWKTGIAPWLTEQSKDHDPFVTLKWDTLGKGESDIALLAEEALEGIEIEKGYRVHLPYVEVKVSYFKSQKKSLQTTLDKLEKALAPLTVSRNGADVADDLVRILRQKSNFHLQDEVTGGFLLGRIFPFAKDIQQVKWSFANFPEPRPVSALSLNLMRIDEFSARAQIVVDGETREEILVAPFITANMAERRLQYFSERALIFWSRNL